MEKVQPTSTVRLACLSDIHGYWPDAEFIGEADAVIIAGDIIENKDHVFLHTFDEYLNELLKDYQKVIFIAGNHDFVLWDCKDWEPTNPNAIYLNGPTWYKQRYTWQGLSFTGFPWTSVHNAPMLAEVWVYMAKTREEIADLLGPIPSADVLVSHGPPFGMLDNIANSPDSCGAHALRIRIADWRVIVCGHIHDGFGTTDDPSGTLIVNTASDYKGMLRRITFDIGPKIPPQNIDVKE